MALRAGYYGIKNALLKKLQGLSDALVIKSIGEGLDLSTAGELSNTSTGGVDYSTTEQDTGIKWIDGRSVYQKVVVLDNSISVSTGTWTRVNGVTTAADWVLLNVLSVGDAMTNLRGSVKVSDISELHVQSYYGTGIPVKNILMLYVKSPANSKQKK